MKNDFVQSNNEYVNWSLKTYAEFINSQASGSSTNYEQWGGGWEGVLATFEPGLGYLLKMGAPAEFYYPEFDGFARIAENKQEVILTVQLQTGILIMEIMNLLVPLQPA